MTLAGGTSSKETFVTYRMPLSPVEIGTPIQEQQEAKFLLDIIPTNPLAADDPPRRSFLAQYSSLVFASRAGTARWNSGDLQGFDQSKKKIFIPERVADVLRGDSTALELTVRADQYLRRNAKPGYHPNIIETLEDGQVNEALNVVNEGGPEWPITRRAKVIEKSSSELIKMTPSPDEMSSSSLWTRLDLSSILGKTNRPVEMLVVQITFEGVDEEFLHGSWWNCAKNDASERGLGFPISTGTIPFDSSKDIGLPCIPRQLILFRPTQDASSYPLSNMIPLNVDGVCAIGMVLEATEPLPHFDESHFFIK